eukprot:1933158-Karenia_brevis.AAC.1
MGTKKWGSTHRDTLRRLLHIWSALFLAAAPGRSPTERYIMIAGNAKLWPLLKEEPFIFPKVRWVHAIREHGPDALSTPRHKYSLAA